MTIKLINRGTEGELLLDGRLDAVTSVEAEELFLQMTERFDKLILNMEKLQYIYLFATIASEENDGHSGADQQAHSKAQNRDSHATQAA